MALFITVDGSDGSDVVAVAVEARGSVGMGAFFKGMDDEGFCRTVAAGACSVLRTGEGLPAADLDDRDCMVGLPDGRAGIQQSAVESAMVSWYLPDGRGTADAAARAAEILSEWCGSVFGEGVEIFTGPSTPSWHSILTTGLSGTVMEGVFERLSSRLDEAALRSSVADAPGRRSRTGGV